MNAQLAPLPADFAVAVSPCQASRVRERARWVGAWLVVCAVLAAAAPSALAQTYQWTNFVGTPATSGNTNGTGSAARFNFPYGIAVDASGNSYIADANNGTIRKVTPAGVVTTLAGLAGNFGTTDATGSAARFNAPTGVAVDSSGKL